MKIASLSFYNFKGGIKGGYTKSLFSVSVIIQISKVGRERKQTQKVVKRKQEKKKEGRRQTALSPYAI